MRTPLFQRRRRDAADPAGTVRVSRRDRGVLRKPVRTAQGFLMAQGIGAVAGVHDYVVRGADGKPRVIKELIDDAVLKQDAGQIGRLPLTLLHPDEDVSPANVQKLGVGDVGERVQYIEDAQGGYVQLSVCTRRADAVDAVNTQAAAELSFGYDVVIDPTPGTHPVYGRYDQRQVARVYNHLALVPQARHGADARLRTDTADLPEGTPGKQLTPKRLDLLTADPTTPQSGAGGSMIEYLRALAAQLKIPRWDSLTEEGLKQALKARGAELQRTADAVDAVRTDAQRDLSLPEVVPALVSAHTAAMTTLRADHATALQAKTDALATLQTAHDGFKTKADAADAAAVTAANAEKLVQLGKLADAHQVSRKAADGTDKDFAALRLDCAAALFGKALPEGFPEAGIDGLIGAGLNRLDGADPDKGGNPKKKADRYTPFTRPATPTINTPTPRPSLRSRIDAKNGRSNA